MMVLVGCRAGRVGCNKSYYYTMLCYVHMCLNVLKCMIVRLQSEITQNESQPACARSFWHGICLIMISEW